jgi:hypothetical protein
MKLNKIFLMAMAAIGICLSVHAMEQGSGGSQGMRWTQKLGQFFEKI